jgi:6-phosphogluconolactonase
MLAHSTVYADADALARGAADWLVGQVAAAPNPAICLSGGSTPRRLYGLMAAPPYRDRLPWDRLHWFWGDERFVPPSDERSNYRMAREALFAHVPVPADHIHPIPTEEATPEAAAAAYEQVLQRYYGAASLAADRPLFTVTLLGLGGNGHTASLFPDTPVLAERKRWAAAVAPGGVEPRITLTYPALESSRAVVFLVSGADKREVVGQIRHGTDFPATRVKPAGELHWFLDRAALGEGTA